MRGIAKRKLEKNNSLIAAESIVVGDGFRVAIDTIDKIPRQHCKGL